MKISVSIHALLAESDKDTTARQQIADVSIHALLAESDRYKKHCLQCNFSFYPRSPCGERLERKCSNMPLGMFLSTLSLRRATYRNSRRLVENAVSIHALLAESDTSRLHKILADWGFYPRSPCGERLLGNVAVVSRTWFLSTLSLRRATNVCRDSDA